MKALLTLLVHMYTVYATSCVTLMYRDFAQYRDALTSVWYSYGSTSFRAGPYLIGSATAMLTAKLKQESYQFSRVSSEYCVGTNTYMFLYLVHN